MARPRQFDREDAVKTAMLAFWTGGYDAVSVNGLCKKLGITRSSFFAAFGSLDELFDECVELYLSGSPNRTVPKSDLPEGLAAIRSFFDGLAAFRCTRSLPSGCMIVKCMADKDVMSDAAKDSLQARADRNPAFFRTQLTAAIEQGELPEDTNIKALVLSLCVLTDGINMMGQNNRNRADYDLVISTSLSGLGLTPQQ